MKTLVVYFSFTNNNELLAQVIQEILKCDIHKIEEERKRSGFTILLDLVFKRKPKLKPHAVPLSVYDQCIFIAPIWAGKIASPLRAFIQQEKYYVNRYSFITVCGGGQSAQRENVAGELTRLMGKEPVVVKELWVSDLVDNQRRQDITSYRIRTGDLGSFSAGIDDFLGHLKTPSKKDSLVREQPIIP